MKMNPKGLVASIIGAVFLILGFVFSQTTEYQWGINSRGRDDETIRYAVTISLIVGAILLLVGLFLVFVFYKTQQNNSNKNQIGSNNYDPINNIINNEVKPNSNVNNEIQGVPCSKCNSLLEPSNKFCHHCGTEIISKKLCPACKNEIPANYSF